MFPHKLLCSALVGVVLSASALAARDDESSDARISIRSGAPEVTIPPEIYGHFAEHLGRCIYGGIWVGEDSEIPNTRGIRNDVVEALKQLDIPVLRWPGGCFADEYHWRDGIGPRAERPAMINTTWGQVVESNHFGTHEFFDLVEQLETKAYIAGNVGSGTPQEMMEWVEYMASPANSPLANLRRANGRDEPWTVDYIGVGNENWGCGGNMRAEYYADLYRRFNTFVKNYGDQKIYRVAGGANSDDVRWTDVLMDRAARNMDGLSLHYYTVPTGEWSKKGPATGFDEDAYRATLKRAWHMKTLLDQHGAIMDSYDPEKRVGLIVDEWGIWTDVEPGTNPAFLYQQNSLRDAIIAALHFQFFHEHADRVHMANIAQTVNVLQAMLLTDGPKMVRTPSYWVFEMYKVHQGGTHLPLDIESPDYGDGDDAIQQVTATASRDAATGTVYLSIVNADPNVTSMVSFDLGDIAPSQVSGRVLTADAVDAHNTFDQPDRVSPIDFNGAVINGDTVNVEMPPKSIVTLSLE